MKRTSTVTQVLPYPIDEVWAVVTDNSDYTWRSDVEKIEQVDEKTFVEHYKGGGATHFTITKKERNKRYTFSMKNKQFIGDWIGVFTALSPESTQIVFTEELIIKNPFIWAVSFFALNLKKIQTRYLSDLEKKIASHKLR